MAFLVSGGLWFRSVEKSLRTELYKRVATQRLANNMSSSMTQWDAVCDSKWYPVGMPSSLSMVWKILSGETAFKRQLLLWYKIQRNIEYKKGWAKYIRTEQIQARKATIITAIWINLMNLFIMLPWNKNISRSPTKWKKKKTYLPNKAAPVGKSSTYRYGVKLKAWKSCLLNRDSTTNMCLFLESASKRVVFNCNKVCIYIYICILYAHTYSYMQFPF